MNNEEKMKKKTSKNEWKTQKKEAKNWKIHIASVKSKSENYLLKYIFVVCVFLFITLYCTYVTDNTDRCTFIKKIRNLLIFIKLLSYFVCEKLKYYDMLSNKT